MALVTGSSRSMGLEFVKQLTQQGYYVYATCRTPTTATHLHSLPNVEILELDVTNANHVANLKNYLKNHPLDIIISNAGVVEQILINATHINTDTIQKIMHVNAIGPINLISALLPNLEQGSEKIVAVLSGKKGSIASNRLGNNYAYRASKSALNCMMRAFAIDTQDKNTKVLLFHPGSVKTDMNPEAIIPVQINLLVVSFSIMKGMSYLGNKVIVFKASTPYYIFILLYLPRKE